MRTHRPPSRLTPLDIVQRYHDDGYVRIDEPLVDEGELRVVRARLDRLFAPSSTLSGDRIRDLSDGTPEQPSVPEIAWTTHADPALLGTVAYRTAERVAAALLGTTRLRLHFDHAIFKPPLVGGRTAWHQDVFFDPGHDCPVATIWMPFVDVDERNGCMQFVPGSHAGPIFDHVPFGRHGREATGVDTSTAVMCPLPAGGMTVHMQRTLHATGSNGSDHVRAAWILKFIPDGRSPARRMASSLVRRRPADAAARRH